MGLLSNSVAAHPYQNQTRVPPGVCVNLTPDTKYTKCVNPTPDIKYKKCVDSIPLLTPNIMNMCQFHFWHQRCVNPTCDTTHNAWHTAYSPLANKEIPKIQYKWGRSTYGWSSDLIWWYWCRLVWGVSRGVECGLHSDWLLVYSLVLGDGDNVLMGHDQTIWCC